MTPDLCCFFPSVCPSVTKRVCHHSASFHSSSLVYGKPKVAPTLPSGAPPHPTRREEFQAWERPHFRLSLALVVPKCRAVLGNPSSVGTRLRSNEGPGNPRPQAECTLLSGTACFFPAATQRLSAAWQDLGIAHSAISSLNTSLSEDLVGGGSVCSVPGSEDRVKGGFPSLHFPCEAVGQG